MIKKKYADRFVGITPKKDKELTNRHWKVLELFSEYRFNRILDIGCGDGNFSIFLKKSCKAEEVFGIDISKKGVDFARLNGVNAFQLDIDEKNFPFENNYFNAIFAGEVIEHLYDPDKMLEECYRVLHPDGIFVLTTRNLASLYNRVTLLLGYQPFPTSVSLRHNVGRPFEVNDEILGGHIRVFTYRAIRELLNLSKFEIIKVWGTSSILPNKNSFFVSIIGLIDLLLSKFPSLSQGLIIKCRKIVLKN